ncbi:50S ribosomal protein L22, chloroplastic-like [Prosopis cineraria]|uniref:50S ribosomal protein L22, chloroplastic-like n=1 Tax=Prosopis cineraria TaxID=364024 RepID=UPI00240F4D08|nr:50S ribosomal protein L22, chloroplastic-like [Prosopis cineraria]
MALSFSQSLSHRPLLHRNLPFSQQSHRIAASKLTAGSLKFPSIRCSSPPNDKTRISLTPCNHSKTYFDPAIGDPLVCRYSARLGGKDSETANVEAYAVGRHIRMSADKARRVIDQIRGRSYEETLMILELMPYRACDVILKLVFSAAANASNNLGLSKGSLVISRAEVNEGKTMKRVRPQARGRAYAIRKRTCHITIAVKGLPSEVEVEASPA